jgi:iron complex outermembrane receptor protein
MRNAASVDQWKISQLKKWTFLVPAVSLCAFSGAAYGEPDAGVALEEITVNARRITESLQDTPVAVTVLGAAAIADRHMQSVAEITQFAPNIQFDSVASESGGGSSTQISIRGIGQTDYTITVEPGVGLYMDGVYIGKSMGSLMDAVDLESIQVLRGPQGTLFGKNTIGGAILLTSRRPGTEPEFMIDASTGRFDRFDLKTSINAPINERLRVRVSGAVLTRGGHVTRVMTGDRQGNKNALTGRLAAELDVTENLRATLVADGTRTREQTPGQIIVRLGEDGFFASLHNTIAFPECAPGGDPARFSNPDCANSQYVRSLKSRENTNIGPNQSDSDIWGTSLTLDWDLGDAAVKSISAYRRTSVDIMQDMLGMPTFLATVGQDIDLKQISQELQVSGRAFNDRLNYLFGLFFLKEKGNQVFPVNMAPVQFISGGAIENESYAAFGHLSYKITDAATLSVGARYSREEKSYRPDQRIVGVPDIYQPFWDFMAFMTGGAFLVQEGLPLFPSVWVSNTDDRFTPSVTLDYRFTEEAMGYFTYSKGYKGGGFTMRGFPPVIPGVTTPETDPEKVIPSFDPETAELFELGLKTDLFDRRVRFNVAGFIMNYNALQLLANSGISAFVPVLINAGDARIKGIEIETDILPASWLRLNAGLGYLDSKYKRLSEAAIGAGASLDHRIPNTPKWTANVGMTVEVVNNDFGRVFLRGDYSFKSSQFKTVTNDPTLFQDDYHVINASINFEHADGHWSAAFGCTNLTNEAYIVSGVTNDGVSASQAIVSRPREWFLNIKYKY